ncbi:MAG: hypothetical protein LC660_08675 [Desulfobacteraceae bacterium]|nr:hypothetical protein [Desulfobacteraceae bacterium]
MMPVEKGDTVFWTIEIDGDFETLSEYCPEDLAWTISDLNCQGKRFEVHEHIIKKADKEKWNIPQNESGFDNAPF